MLRSYSDAMAQTENAFKALLRYWRNQRGMSQLDLGLMAEVSSRHISFLETGRSQPSVEMVLLLAEVLDVPLRDRNELLRTAGFEPRYAEPTIDELLAGPIGTTLDTMLEHHAPYPMVVFDRTWDVLLSNKAAASLFGLVGVDAETRPNLLRLLLDPVFRPFVDAWEEVAGQALRRAQRDLMDRPNDYRLAALLTDVLNYPDIPADWRSPSLFDVGDPTLSLRLNLGDVTLNLLTTITVFSAANNVTLEELQIESYLPLDDATADYFRSVAVTTDR